MFSRGSRKKKQKTLGFTPGILGGVASQDIFYSNMLLSLSIGLLDIVHRIIRCNDHVSLPIFMLIICKYMLLCAVFSHLYFV